MEEDQRPSIGFFGERGIEKTGCGVAPMVFELYVGSSVVFWFVYICTRYFVRQWQREL